MKSILLIGLGRFGYHTAIKLNELRHEVMAVDSREDRVDRVMPYVTNAMIGDTTSEDFLASLGVSDFDVCLVTIADNFQNSLVTTSLLKELGARYVASRAASGVHAKFLLRNGADSVIYPEKQLADWAAVRYSSDHILDYIELDDTHSIFEVNVPDSWDGKTIGGINVRRNHNISILAIKHNGVLNMRISPETVLREEDTLLVLGELQDVEKCFR